MALASIWIERDVALNPLVLCVKNWDFYQVNFTLM